MTRLIRSRQAPAVPSVSALTRHRTPLELKLAVGVVLLLAFLSMLWVSEALQVREEQIEHCVAALEHPRQYCEIIVDRTMSESIQE